MPLKNNGSRITGERRAIKYSQTQAFFDARGRASGETPLTATMYQDPALAQRRDEAEKSKVLPLLAVRAADRVLDVGCGIGRWAEAIAPLAGEYLGLDFSEPLLTAARSRVPGAVFQQMPVNAIDIAALQIAPPFTLLICSGILAYINDADALRLFDTVSLAMASEGRIYIREPIAKSERLTLDEYWSDELSSAYSAIYRTRAEYLELFAALSSFELRLETAPFEPALEKRVETEQHCFLLERQPRL